MAQRTDGLRSILSLPFFYRFAQNFFYSPGSRREVVDKYIRPAPGDRILDIGCGPADVLGYLPEVEYFGFDMNEKYIQAARKRFGGRGTFRCENVSTKTLEGMGGFNIVLALAILHHLDDDEAVKLFTLARAALAPGGRLVTLDSCYTDDQSRIARRLIDRDRGRNTRTETGYAQLASMVFPNVKSSIRHDVFRIPYTLIFMECSD